MKTFAFEAHDHAGSWMPMGVNEDGDEVWVDGCCVKDKRLAERIAANMEAAFAAGVREAARSFVRHAVDTTAKVQEEISGTTSFGGWVIPRK